MALIFNGNLPTISGNIKVEVPTPTYSGKKSSNAADSINPYTMQGPGEGGAGQTAEDIEIIRSGGNLANPTTWNPADLNGGMTLSNSDLTVSHAGNFGGVRSVASVTSGKWYWETHIDTFGSATGIEFGIATSTASLTTNGTASGLWLLNGFNGTRLLEGSSSVYSSAVTLNDTISVALDMDIGAMWLSVNGIWGAGATISEIEVGTTTNAMVTGLTGIIHAIINDGSSSNSWVATTNFGGLAFTHTVPIGFTNGLFV